MKKMLILFGVIFALMMAFSVSAVLTDELLSYYKLEGTGDATDELGNNTMTMVGSVGSTTGIVGNGRTGFDLTNFFRKTDAIGLPNLDNDDFTMTIWAKSSSAPTSSQQCFFGTGNTNDTGYQMQEFCFNSDGTFLYDIFLSGSSGSGVYTPSNYDTNWHFYSATYDHTTKNWSVYLDGAYINSSIYGDSGGYVPLNLYLGQRFLEDQNNSDVTIDEASFWGRTLSTGEISALYNSGSGLSYPFEVVCSVCNETCSPCGGGCTATDMTGMFNSVTDFNTTIGDITGWNTSCITNMNQMFQASDFNQDISGWDVSSVTNMQGMFSNDLVFDQPIGTWDTSGVTNMNSLFRGNHHGLATFNQDISGWDTSHVTDMQYMFMYSNFNQPIGSWNVSNVDRMYSMFYYDTAFDQDLSGWDISSNIDVSSMFTGDTLSVANYDALLLGWGSEVVQNAMSFDAGNSMYSNTGKAGRDILTDTYNWTIYDGGLVPCTPDWLCSGYGSCLENNTQLCNDTIDNNTCGEEYTGNFSEFTPQVCDFCTPDWNCTEFTSCVADHKNCTFVDDLNLCGELFEGNLSDYDENCTTPPPITGYVSSYGTGDLPKLTFDVIGEVLLVAISLIGVVVGFSVVVFLANKVKGFKGGK